MAFALPSYLAARGLDAQAIGGVLAMTTAPYAFKVVWGPLIDAFPGRSGRRRPWIVFAQLMMAVTIATMIAIADHLENLAALSWMIFVHTVFNSIQDVAVDGLAVDILDPAERARTNGLMYASKWAGGGIGGWGMAKLIAHYNLKTALVVQVIVLLAILVLPLTLAERAHEPQRPTARVKAMVASIRSALGSQRLSSWMRAPGMKAAAACGIVMLGSNIAAGMLSAISPVVFTHDLGWAAQEWSSLAAGPGLACGLLGSVLGGVWADKVGHRKLAARATAGLVGGYVLWAVIAPYWANRATVYATFWIEPLLQGMASVSLCALCMDVCWPKIAASQFAGYMALSNLSTTLGAKLAGLAAHTWTYPGVWLVAAGLQLVPIWGLYLVGAHRVEQRGNVA